MWQLFTLQRLSLASISHIPALWHVSWAHDTFFRHVTWPSHWLPLHFWYFSCSSAPFLHLFAPFLSFSTCYSASAPVLTFFSMILPPFCTASASEHVSCTLAHFQHCILSLLSLPLTSADTLPFVHPYICLYICSGFDICSFSLNINYRAPPFISVCFHTLPFPSDMKAQHTIEAMLFSASLFGDLLSFPPLFRLSLTSHWRCYMPCDRTTSQQLHWLKTTNFTPGPNILTYIFISSAGSLKMAPFTLFIALPTIWLLTSLPKH